MGEFKPQSISFSAVNILFSITATLGNSLILATLHKESYPHPPSKLFYRCLATTDLLVFLVTQPVAATYWTSLVHEHWIRYPWDVGYITGFTLRGVWSFSVYNDGHKREPTSRRVVGTEIQRYCHSEVHVHHFSYSLGCMSSRWFILSTRSPYNLMVQPYKYIIFFWWSQSPHTQRFFALSVIIGLKYKIMLNNSRANQMHWTWSDTERQCTVHYGSS